MDYPFCPSPPYVPGDPGMYDLRDHPRVGGEKTKKIP